jgi:hypothetical protein
MNLHQQLDDSHDEGLRPNRTLDLASPVRSQPRLQVGNFMLTSPKAGGDAEGQGVTFAEFSPEQRSNSRMLRNFAS